MDNNTKNIPQESGLPKNNSGIKASPAGGLESLIDDLNLTGISSGVSPREPNRAVNS